MNVKQAKNILIVSLLERLNIPIEKKMKYEWLLKSPLRDEKTPSFYVNLAKNVFMDFGTGQGGSIVDLAMLLNKTTSVSKALDFIEQTMAKGGFSFSQQASALDNVYQGKDTSKIMLLKEKPLSNGALIRYLRWERCISPAISKKYLREVYYQIGEKRYFSAAFQNNSGGFELRNRYYKNCIAPKDITIIKQRDDRPLVLFEGFIDFLSLLEARLDGGEGGHFLILNSLSNIKKALSYIRKNKAVIAMLDNDEAGKRITDFIANECLESNVINGATLYEGYKDLNEWLIERKRNGLNEIARRLGVDDFS